MSSKYLISLTIFILLAISINTSYEGDTFVPTEGDIVDTIRDSDSGKISN